jgi:uncharacterized protein YjeT (DUF2065 family)
VSERVRERTKWSLRWIGLAIFLVTVVLIWIVRGYH